jgi:GPH family glycoside/pentoside/hexuronide:cation symporter
MISASSMIAEIVEAFEEKTGRRAEGAFYSGNWLIQKCATGLGIFLTGQIISLSGLPDGAQPGAVDQAVITDIIVYFGAILAVLAVIAAGFLFRFPISRADHDARLERLSARRTLDEAARGDIDAGTIVP